MIKGAIFVLYVAVIAVVSWIVTHVKEHQHAGLQCYYKHKDCCSVGERPEYQSVQCLRCDYSNPNIEPELRKTQYQPGDLFK